MNCRYDVDQLQSTIAKFDTAQGEETYHDNAVVRAVYCRDKESRRRLIDTSLGVIQLQCHLSSKVPNPRHMWVDVAIPQPLRHHDPGPLNCTPNCVLGEPEEELDGLDERLSALQHLGLVLVDGDVDVNVGDVLVDVVLGVFAFGVFRRLHEVAEPEHVGNEASDDGVGDADGRNVEGRE